MDQRYEVFTGEPGAMKVASPVRRGAVGKVPARVTRWPPTLPARSVWGGDRSQDPTYRYDPRDPL